MITKVIGICAGALGIFIAALIFIILRCAIRTRNDKEFN
jgi:hypothetical protein